MAGVLVELRVPLRSLDDAAPGDLREVSGDLARYLVVNRLARRRGVRPPKYPLRWSRDVAED